MENNNLKIIFIGTPEFGAIVLENLVKNNYQPILVVTNPDKPVGRKQTITPPPVKLVAKKNNIPIIQPTLIRNSKFEIQNSSPDLIIVAAYGQIISKEILDIPKYGCLNIHPSLLPKYRGASPIQTAILNGEQKNGVTIMLMDEKMDHGPILAAQELEITDFAPGAKICTWCKKTTYQELHNKSAELGAKLLMETIPNWINGKIKPKPQDETKATYTKILKKEDGKIDWDKPAEEIERQIRAFNPWPGSFTFCKKNDKNIKVKILEADVSDNKLIIKKVQPEGKKPMDYKEFLNQGGLKIKN
jgi:methionyl-tRNA formyltransferase